ncbi:MAG: GAF domain-containing protein, partial [Anaerolineae bacterium]|nr:GAF domain-containing protein [Anaerolineae bacterium]
ALDTICASVHARFGLLTLCENNQLRLAATYRWHGSELHIDPGDLRADDVLPLEPGYFAPPLAEAALLIPLHAETEQLGALILGQPVNSTHFSQADIELLLYPSDRIADTIQNIQREAEYLDQIAALVEINQPTIFPTPMEFSVKVVEDALRNLSNYAYLGEHSLAKTKLVKAGLPPGTVTHLDRGKVVYRVVAEAVEKLCPDGAIPSDPPPREWYPYMILHSAYFEDVPNRDIMSRLYISEGTFNRTRRAALRAVTQTLEEMEMAAK